MADLTPYEDQEKIPIGMLVRGVAGLIPFADELKMRYRSNILVRGGGGFDSFSRQPEGKIAINIVVRGGGRFDPS